MLNNPRILIASAASIMVLCACNPTDHSKDTNISKPAVTSQAAVVATVNGAPISENQINLLLKQRHEQPDTPGMRKEIVDQLSIQIILSQEAVKKGLNKMPDVSDQIDLTQQSILANAYIQDYLKSDPVSEDKLKTEYEKIKGKMSGSEYKARHILLDNEADAKDIIAKLKKNPKAFESLAIEKSKDTGSKQNGGDLGWFDPRTMAPEFGAAMTKLTKGNFTAEPVKSQFGYHVILLEDSRLKSIPPLDQVKPMLLQQIQQQNVKKLIDDLKAKAKIEITQTAAPAISPTKESKTAEPGK